MIKRNEKNKNWSNRRFRRMSYMLVYLRENFLKIQKEFELMN
jgi:hypothetical protein